MSERLQYPLTTVLSVSHGHCHWSILGWHLAKRLLSATNQGLAGIAGSATQAGRDRAGMASWDCDQGINVPLMFYRGD